MDKCTTTPDGSIPRRRYSTSSDRSEASSGSEGLGAASSHPSSHGDHPEPFVLSGANTPLPETRLEASPSPHVHLDYMRRISVPRSAGAGPIAIEMPVLPRKPRTAAAMTPPAPLSARGDVVGYVELVSPIPAEPVLPTAISSGYFPLHEDPTKRVRRPHPFDPDAGSSPRVPSPEGRARASHAASAHPSLALDGEPMEAPSVPTCDALVTSYAPSGLHGASLPMGKYYPSNYERSHRQRAAPNPHKPVKSASQVPTYGGAGSSQKALLEGDARQKLQQYQRDMVAQATLAARRVMSGSPEQSVGISGIPTHGLPFSAPATANPASPRLRPLGSPGPVTPMELEGPEGSYLDKGRAPSVVERSTRDRERRQPMSPGNRMRAETRSPVATPAF